MMFSFLILLGLVLLFIFWAVAIYNGLIAARNAYKNAFAQIDVQLQRRFELIPNLVEIAKRYMAHERETLEAVMTARSAAMSGAAAAKSVPGDPAAMARLGSSEGVLGGALGRLMMVAEAYPELQANQTMRELTEELRSTENRVAFSRQAYNDGVTVYNNRREVFPASLIAGNCGFRPAGLLAIPSAEAEMRQSPKVAF
ncbi:LemA family protein [Lysobacter sp. H23M47]|uniref:LemA family protein n=1 Tax=Lysobacter sp. H23M47 TaxID=2781024 RepID=UPI0018828CFF|nr:LemA family protein [Lysobacter sp. H23M47]QOW24357.1 LemA family protein [Lysobacter sp. H23M47]